MTTRASDDLHAWRRWKSEPTDDTREELLQQLNPLIHKEVNRWSTGSVPRFYLEHRARRLALDAAKTYNPDRGVALGTHTVNGLKKLSRVVYTHQQVARVPEYRTLQSASFRRAETDLTSKLGRDPTTEELADELSWSPKYLGTFLQQGPRRELIETGAAAPVFGRVADDPLVDYAYQGLDAMDKRIFEHTTGFGGKAILDNDALSRKLGLTAGQLSYRKRKMVELIGKFV